MVSALILGDFQRDAFATVWFPGSAREPTDSRLRRFGGEAEPRRQFVTRQSLGNEEKWLEQQGHLFDAVTANDFDTFDHTWHVQQTIRLAISLGPLLSRRQWNLWIAEDQAPDLICSDSPVVPTWVVPTSGSHSPGFGTPNTVVSVPLSKRMALVSMLDIDVGPRMLGRDEVAQLNSATGMYAGQLYCPAPDFVWLTKDGRVGNRDGLLQ